MPRSAGPLAAAPGVPEAVAPRVLLWDRVVPGKLLRSAPVLRSEASGRSATVVQTLTTVLVAQMAERRSSTRKRLLCSMPGEKGRSKKHLHNIPAGVAVRLLDLLGDLHGHVLRYGLAPLPASSPESPVSAPHWTAVALGLTDLLHITGSHLRSHAVPDSSGSTVKQSNSNRCHTIQFACSTACLLPKACGNQCLHMSRQFSRAQPLSRITS